MSGKTTNFHKLQFAFANIARGNAIFSEERIEQIFPL
jgi:hypothetical protein